MKQGLSINQEIDNFLVFQESLGHKRSTYESQLHSFADFFLENYNGAISLSHDIIMDYMDHQTHGLAQKARVLRLFGRYLVAMGKEAHILSESMYKVPMNNKPYIFSDSELHAVFDEIDSLDKNTGWLAVVAPVLYRLIYTCGLRPREARELRTRHINFEIGEVFIKESKGKKDRTVVMSEDMRNLCCSFKKKRTIAGMNSVFFFAKPDGFPYSETIINNTFVTCWKRSVGLKPNEPYKQRIRVYSLRHRFATAVIHRWIDEKQDLRNKLPYLQEYMGHSNLTDTIYYLHLLPENLVQSPGIDWDAFDGIIPEVWK